MRDRSPSTPRVIVRPAWHGLAHAGRAVGWLAVVVVGVVTVADPSAWATGEVAAQDPAAEAGMLANRLAETESRLSELSDRMELKWEEANKARVDLARSEHDVAMAQELARSTAGEAQAATQLIGRRRKLLDEFLAASYRQGSLLGSLTAFVGAHSPQDVLDRAEMLDIIGSQLDRPRDLQLARIEKANKDAAARRALCDAGAKKAVAAVAQAAAEAAERAAVAERAAGEERARALQAETARAATRLAVARERATGVAGGVATEGAWRDGPPGAPGSTDHDAELVVQRALSQVGVAYVWGGGDAAGPTLGLHDGGVSDLDGHDRKVGFDCSGLMVYAFSGAGVDQPHYTGYQYLAGRQVPVADARRGDMLFWQDGGSIYHVALYLGNGQMVEAAPGSGHGVEVTPVRYGGIAPYAVRML